MLTATPEADRAASLRSGLPGRIIAAASRPVPAASVAAFRVGFGLLVAYSSIRFLAKGWVDTLYLDPAHHLGYRWFGWVEPLPSPLMHLHVAGLAALGLAVALGCRHRLAAGLLLIGFTYAELIDAALYLNHYWFVTLAALLMLLLPVHHQWSLDARAGRVERSTVVPAGVVWVLRAQLAAVYVFAGIAKLNSDWLVRAQPMQLWLADRADTPLIGWLLDGPGIAHAMSWAGAAFDCTIVVLLLWRRTRPVAYVVLVVFHAMTGLLFQIGVFPVVMIVSTLVFFEPDWPLRFVPRRARVGSGTAPAPRVGPLVLGVLAVVGVTQLWLPVRHYAQDSNVRWSEEGYYLSWRVMLTEKAGFVDYEVTDPSTGESWEVDASLVLEDWQRSVAATKPDLIHATALLIADHYRDRGPVEVRAIAWVAMNGRPAAPIVDPELDLAAHDRGQLPAEWILREPSR